MLRFEDMGKPRTMTALALEYLRKTEEYHRKEAERCNQLQLLFNYTLLRRREITRKEYDTIQALANHTKKAPQEIFEEVFGKSFFN